MLPHDAITANGRFGARRWNVTSGEVWLNPMPMFHVAGSVINALGALSAGATQLLCAFEPTTVANLILDHQVSVACMAGTMWTMLLDLPSADLRSVRAAIAGGQHIAPDLVRRIEGATGGRMSVLFGMTELCGTVTASALDDDAQTRWETCGTPLPGVQIRIVDAEVQVRGWLTMGGYFEDPEATDATLIDDGWLRTGDVGSIDAQGRLRITGRIKEMIIRGGENIYPTEIEIRLCEHPAIAGAAVVGLPDPLYGETVAAALVLRAGFDAPTDDELSEWCRAALAPFKTPKQWLVVQSLPTTPSGKVQKFLVQEAFRSKVR
jgi:acyl-CoA synthetase (AMP-forming)/AMP-acid ligase II